MAKLDELHAWCGRELATVPESRRVMVTAHDAFSYFGKAYGVEVKAIQGVSTAARASISHIEELVTDIVRNRIKAVFVETSVSPRTINQLIEGCAAKGHTVTRGGELFSDAMGKDGTPEGTYEGMIRHNVTTIVKALK
jgi:manganese/zinc/iron transport system substrate-binding protein